jgi:cobalt-zinc-cadmium efflux system protein
MHSDNRIHHHRDIKSENLVAAIFLNFAITIVEIYGGILSNSYALLSDAMHNFGDTIAIFLAYLSYKIGKRTPTLTKTFGFKRIEILAALINGIALIIICIFLIYGAVIRLKSPASINGLIMVVIAIIGLLGNFIAMALLKKDKEKNLNIRAAYLHLLADALSSLAVVAGGILIFFYKIFWLDPIITFVISIYILKEAWYILKQSYLILLQATPDDLDLTKVKSSIETISEIEDIHHIHAWKLNDTQIHFECHVDLKRDYKISETEEILFKIKNLLKDDYNIIHTTIQFEYNCCDDKSIIKNY